MTKTPVALGVAGSVLGAIGGLGVLAIVWRSAEHLNEWGDEHMGAACAIQLGTVLVGAVVGGILGHFMARR